MASYLLVPSAAIAAATPTALPADAPAFRLVKAVRAITTGEGSGTTAPTANPAAATVKNVTSMPATPGATEFDFDYATSEWQYGSASGPQATGTLCFEIEGYVQGEIPALS